MNRTERRQMKKHEKKYGEKQLHQNIGLFLEDILRKIDMGLELNEEENVLFSMMFEEYRYKKNSKSLIKSHIISNLEFKEQKQYEIIMKNKFVENFVDVCFESINNIIEENKQLRQKIIDYWRKVYCTEEKICQLYKNMKENNHKELPDFETFKKEFFSAENIFDMDINEKLSLKERDFLTKCGINVSNSVAETVNEHNERLLSNQEYRAKFLKKVLDNLPAFDTLLKCLEENSPEENNESVLIVVDIINLIFDSNKFRDAPNYTIFLKELINSKHSIIEQLLKHIEYKCQEYNNKYNNPTVLDVNKINSPLEQIKKIKYRHEAEKR